MRKVDRHYSKCTDTWGAGRPLTSLTDRELNQEIEERAAENPTAYRNNFNPYLLQNTDSGATSHKKRVN